MMDLTMTASRGFADVYERHSSHRGCCELVLLHEGKVSGMQT